MKLRQAPKIDRFDLFLTLLPALLWPLLLQSRSKVIELSCASPKPECTPAAVNWMDRWMIGEEDLRFMVASDWTQYAVGALLFLSPVVLSLRSPSKKLTTLGVGLLIAVQTTLWNGLLTEITRLLVQRPRPFVYVNPAEHGPDPAHYTSFYSGHTSFSFAAATALFWMLFSSSVHKNQRVLWSTLAYLLAATTGLFRVLSDRHFPTDVVAGAIAGFCVATAIAYFHRASGRTVV